MAAGKCSGGSQSARYTKQVLVHHAFFFSKILEKVVPIRTGNLDFKNLLNYVRIEVFYFPDETTALFRLPRI